MGARHAKGKDVENGKEDKRLSGIPRKDDPAEVFVKKKEKLLNRIVPMTLVPMATSNAMLVMGAGMNLNEDCYFALPQFLIVGGSVSLALVVMTVVCKYIIEFILYDREVTSAGRCVIRLLEYLGTYLAGIQVLIICGGSLLVFPELSTVKNVRPDEGEPNYYCKYSAVTFSTMVLILSWLFIAYMSVSYFYIKCYQKNDKLFGNAALTQSSRNRGVWKQEVLAAPTKRDLTTNKSPTAGGGPPP